MIKERMIVCSLVAVVILGFGFGSSSASSRDGFGRGRAKSPWWADSSPSSSYSVLGNFAGSSFVFPLHGNVYPTGTYNVTIKVGQPPKPYFLDPDTGSDLTWLQCDAPCTHCTQTPHPLYRPTKDLVICRDPICASLHSHDEYNCDDVPEQCDYEVEYADGGSSLGVLVKDAFSLKSSSGVPVSPRLILGCGYDQLPGASNPFLDGVLGLGKGKSGILSQLHSQGLVRNVMGHCLSGRGGGYLFFGNDPFDYSRAVWVTMARDTRNYSPGTAELLFGGKSTGMKDLLIVFDTGSSYTYLCSQTYNTLTSMVKKDLSGKPFKEALDDHTLSLCWSGRKPFKSVREVKKYFKPLALSFADGGKSKNQFDIPPESYLIISSKGNVCLGILNGTEAGLQNMNVIGDISMLDKTIIYDNERQLIGWAPANCDRPPKSSSVHIFR
ncbi:hypothetical protein MLD38_028407 [Melastoma candidum]|uniref:Uncharacterized protein n=1 Tax=Melastoma candidum TaxID=119954 RepID=A0ACB9N0Q9_9MYRT|nr:hypothetical protein MLD38_028407 [Melastoma candidum]